MNILSLFDGMSCGQIALNKTSIKYEKYFASEIDKNAIKITQSNYPNTIQLGDIKSIKGSNLPQIDLLIGGSPCTSLSIAKRQKESGLVKGDSVLFWEYVRILNEVKPKYFLLENVASMKKVDKNKITEVLGVQPITINSALVSAQMRKRHYWANIPNITQPEDKKIYLKDILECGYTEKDKSYCLTATYARACLKDYDIEYCQRQMVFNKPIKVYIHGKTDSQSNRVYSIDGKSVTISANGGGKGAKTGLYEVLKGYARKLAALECCRLQTVPETYFDGCGLSENQKIKLLGNGFTVDVISHILKHIRKSR
jgi:DNA (cytosine-5)-methyltransferase 3A